MLAMIARRVPVMATFSASLVDSCAWPFSILTSMSADLAIDSVPFGPLTLTLSAWTFNSPPFGRAIGFLATRDISMTPLGHEAQDRSEERRVGKECVSTCRYRWSPYH